MDSGDINDMSSINYNKKKRIILRNDIKQENNANNNEQNPQRGLIHSFEKNNLKNCLDRKNFSDLREIQKNKVIISSLKKAKPNHKLKLYDTYRDET